MAVLSALRSLTLFLIFIFICCGCSSGSGNPMTPGIPSNQQFDPSRFASDQFGSSDDTMNIDPRFKGWIDTDFDEKYDFNWSSPPDWAQPGIGDIEFDRLLKGWIVDPHHRLNTLSLTLSADDFDLTNDLTYMAEVLPDGGYVYHWQCESPEKLLDSQRHFVQVFISTLDKTPLHRFDHPQFKPLVLTGIGALYYPWRDVRLHVEDQTFD